MTQKRTIIVKQDKSVVKWNMESNKTCGQVRQNMNIYIKGHECSKMKYAIK